jgi:hypothetical protein
LFYDVFDTHFVLKSPKRHDILKILINYAKKQPGPVSAGLVPASPVRAGLCRSVPVPVPVVPAADRCLPVLVPLTDRKKRCM